MNFTQVLLVLIIVIPLILVILGRLRIDLAALGMAVLLSSLQLAGFGLLGPAEAPAESIKAISGFGQPVVITLISLFILTHGLEKSGVTSWLAQQLVRLGGSRINRLILLLSALTAFLSLFMNNLAAGALVLPCAMEAARRTGIHPSKLLIPVAYGSLLGGSATYFTTANIIMSDLLRIAKPPQAPLGILDFTPTGGLIALAGILFLAVCGSHLLPDREPAPEQVIARKSKEELGSLYQIGERLWEARVLDSSTIIGNSLASSNIGCQFGVSVAGVRRIKGYFAAPEKDRLITKGDILLLIGREEKISGLKRLGMDIYPLNQDHQDILRGIPFFEVILSPHSSMDGLTLKQIDFRRKYGLTVIAIKRLGRNFRTDVGDIQLKMGDSLLASGKYEQTSLLRRNKDLILLESETTEQPIEKRKAIVTILLLCMAIAASIFGIPVHLSMLAAVVLILALKIFPVEEAYRSVEWQAVFLIAGMYAVSLAMVQTGLASLLGEGMITLARPLGPLGVAAGAYLLTALLTQFMGGQVAALVTGPITISAALSMGVNPQAVAVATAIGCSASFFTPMAHPVNILMVAPANYKFIDFIRAGWPLTLLSFFMLLASLKLFWHM